MHSAMKRIDIGNLFSLLLPHHAVWSFDNVQGKLSVTSEVPKFEIGLYLLEQVDTGRMEACYEHLERHVREEIGPPFQTSVQEVAGENWAGYQAVTSLDSQWFCINRCVMSPLNSLLLRIEFKARKDDVDTSLMQVVESLEFYKEE